MGLDSYGITIPVDVTGLSQLQQLRSAIQGDTDAFRGLNAQMQEFARQVREEVSATGNLNKALNEIRTGATGASESFKSLAGQLQAYNLQARAAEQQATRLQQVLATIGGRLGGMASGIPGGGFIGAQAIRGLGLSGGAALGVGAAGLGLFAAMDITKQVADLGKWVQEQQNAARAVGATVSQMESLSRLSERTGVNMESVAKAMSNLGDELFKGGARAKEIQTALGQLGLPTSTAFKDPVSGLQDVAAALGRIGDSSQRLSVAKELLGEMGGQLAAVAGDVSKLNEMSIFSDEQNQQLIDVKNAVDDLGDAWKQLLAIVSTPVRLGVQGAEGIMNFIQMFTGFGLNTGTGPHAGTYGAGPTKPLDQMEPAESKRRLAYYQSISQTVGTPSEQYAAQIADLNQQKDALIQSYKSGDIYRDSEFKSGYQGITSKIATAQEQKRIAEERERQQEQFQKLIGEGVPEDFMDAGRLAARIAERV